MDPEFLGLEEILEIHRDQLERYGGLSGIRDLDLLCSSAAAPAAGHASGYFHENIYEMGAAYLFHILRDHPFLDGNKRTAVVAALVFLELNGITVRAKEEDFYELVMALIRGEAGKAEAAVFFRRSAAEAIKE